MNYFLIMDLLDKGDRWSLRRAENLLKAHLQSYLSRPLLKSDMVETFQWLARIELARKNYGRTLQYLLNACEIMEFLPDSIEDIVRAKLYCSQLLVKVKRYSEAENLVIEANALAGGMGSREFRLEVKNTSNSILDKLFHDRRDMGR